MNKLNLTVLAILSSLVCCTQQKRSEAAQELQTNLVPVIIDTDANNELDDQHALAYALFNSDIF